MSIPQANCRKLGRFCLVLLTVLALVSFVSLLSAQTTVGTGSIVGTVTDPSGAVVPGARVTITNTATGQNIETVSNNSGAFNSGALAPGNYKVQVAAKGFSTVSVPVTVMVGNTATAYAKLALERAK
ncbi:MAG TPA: carboxypeptidase-like regulatory domain-containing protein [Terriglobales bacterium]|nr:carboxypeptidase-like regulatory domain-containing protein [Terriglobales bacterium]